MTTNDLWFTARGAGLAAMLILTIATALGALGSTRLRSVSNRVIIQYMHRTAAVLGLSLIVVHVTTLVLDSKSHVSLAGALVPFAAHYRPSAVALGSIAMYLVLFVAALGLARGRLAASRAGAATWRGLHLLAYPAWGIAIVHGLMAGTDRSQNWVVLLTLGCAVAVLVAVAWRVSGINADEPTTPAPTSTPRLTGASR
jgi:DMSO/TMAO reductase YedYZ heme-binding membrane subunit